MGIDRPYRPLSRPFRPVPWAAVGLGLAAAVLAPKVAWADDVRMALLPTGPVGPGDTAEVRLLAIDADGKPLEGLSVEATVDDGEAGAWEELGGGLYVGTVSYDPNGATPTLHLKGTAEGVQVELDASLHVQLPVAAERLPMTAEPAQAVLGRDDAITIEALGAGPQGLRMRANTGELARPVSTERATTVAYTPPKVNFPQVAVITSASVAQPTDSFGFTFVPLVGSVAFPVKGPAGAAVQLEVAGKTFGPITLAATGKGKVPIEVPPGVQEAKQTTVHGSDTTTHTLDLGIPATQRLGLLPLPHTVATGSDPVPLRVAVAQADGEPDGSASVVFEVSRGSVGKVKSLGGGLYQALWTVPDTPGKATVGVSLDGDPLQVDDGTVQVEAGALGTVRLKADPWPAEDGGTVEVVVESDDVPADALTVAVLGGKAGDESVRDGALRVTVDSVQLAALRISGGASLQPSRDGVRHVVVLPASASASATAQVPVLVATVDDDGLPVPKQPVSLEVTSGSASVPSSATTGDDGTVLVTLDLEGADELVTLRVMSHDYLGEAAVMPLPGLAGAEAWASIGPFARAWRQRNPMLLPPDAAPEPEALPWGVAPVVDPAAEPETEPVAVAPAEVMPTQEPEVPFLRLRASAVVSSYRYEQTPGADPGAVLDRALVVGGSGGTPASPGGFELDGRVWLDPANVPYLGFHGSLRTTWYSIRSDAFAQPAADQLLQGRLDLLLRYPVDAGSDLFWVGGRAGFHYDDFIYFEGCVDEAGCTLGYQPLGVPGLALGPELGAEIGPVFLIGGYTFGLANFGQPYLHAFDLDAGLQLVGPLFAEIGFGTVSRQVELVGAETETVRGRLSDAQMLFDVGVGVAF